MDYQVDGIIAASVSLSSNLAQRAESLGIPVVLFNRGQDDANFSTVSSANLAGGGQVAEFLLAGGHKRIAHIAGWQGSTTGRDRKTGFVRTLEAAGAAPVAVLDGMYNRDTAIECTRRIMDAPQTPDAIFVGNDHMAFAVLDELRAGGVQPGKDISVIGYDDVPLASWGAYQLTTVRQPVNRMVQATIDLLLERIENPQTPASTIEIGGDLIIRSSARIPENWNDEEL